MYQYIIHEDEDGSVSYCINGEAYELPVNFTSQATGSNSGLAASREERLVDVHSKGLGRTCRASLYILPPLFNILPFEINGIRWHITRRVRDLTRNSICLFSDISCDWTGTYSGRSKEHECCGQ